MNPDAQQAINAVGAMSEMLGIFLRELIKNGFTRDEAFALCQVYLSTTLSNGKDED
jgi:hypothetical protein